MDFDTPDPQQPQYQPQPQQTHWQQPLAPAAPTPGPAPMQGPAPQQWGPAPQPQQQHMQPPQPLYTPPAPTPPMPQAPRPVPAMLQVPEDTVRPVAVVKVLSPVGLEYVFLTILLFIGAGSLMSALLLLIDGSTSFEALSFPAALLLVTVPLFAFLFLRLKKLELQNPDLRLDPSKRRSTQFTQIVAFLFSLGALIGLVFSILAKIGGINGLPVWKAMLNALCIFAVSGGVFAYYWYDEHKVRR